MKEELKVRNPHKSVRDEFPVDPDMRFNFYVQRWNRWPDYPVYLWSSDGKRSVPGQLLNEAGVRSDFLTCDDDMPIYGKRLRYLNTHVVPDDIVKISAKWSFIGEHLTPSDIPHLHPAEVLKRPPLPIPFALLSNKSEKLWDVLIKLNDGVFYIDMDSDTVIDCIPWQTRAYWIRETLRHFGVGITFRYGNK